jgi:hypothetical protein
MGRPALVTPSGPRDTGPVTEATTGGAPDTGEPAPDMEYDLAHEEEAARRAGAEPAAAQEAIQAATQTADYDGDYGYDLVHDIPPPGPPR